MKKTAHKIQKRQPLSREWELVELDEMTWIEAAQKAAAQLVENGGNAVEVRFAEGLWPTGWTYIPQFLD